MSRYAASTSVSSAKSREEIERILSRYGADGFMYGWVDDRATVAFRVHSRHIKFLLPMPSRNDVQFRLTPARGSVRSPERIAAAYEQAIRQRWRALALAIKAKLEAVAAGITEFEEEFMAHIVLPDGQTVGQHMRPQIAHAYDTGDMPPLLPFHGHTP